MNNELLDKLKELAKKDITLSDLCKLMKLNEYEILGLVTELRNEHINIVTTCKDDGLHLYNIGEKELPSENTYTLETNENNEINFVVISDTRIGSKSQQLSILSDIYANAERFGFDKVLHCGNISEGLYPIKGKKAKYANSLFLDDSLRQVTYIAEKYPYIEGIKTYFITGPKDETHLKENVVNIGKRISDLREDMIYLGENSCTINIEKIKMLMLNLDLQKTYTSSYRPQQMINSFRSEDKPDIMLYGGLLQMEKFTHREVFNITIPSMTATTPEMTQKRYNNTIGAWFITIKINKKGFLESIKAVASPYYLTNKNDYIKPKLLKLTKEGK